MFGSSLGRALVPPAVLLVLQIVGTTGIAFHEVGSSGRFPLDWFGYLLLIIGPLVLTVRERWPVPALLGVVGISLLYVLLGYPYGPFICSVIVAVVHAVKARHRVIAWSAFLGLLGLHFAVLAVLGELPGTVNVGAITGWVVVVLASAEVVRGVSERREARDRVREAEEANRLTEERLRIARELHDVVAHNISLINVQAGAALHLLDRRPEQARTALSTIKQSSKDTLVELRSILGVLRQADSDQPSGPEQPAPGLARLPTLVENARQAGLTVQVRAAAGVATDGKLLADAASNPDSPLGESGEEVRAEPHTELDDAPHGDPAGDVGDELGALPDRVDLAVYRILQEAITNVIRHARADRIWITLERKRGVDAASLRIDVADDGIGGVADPSGNRSGLLGMRERAEALGGSFRAGPRTGNAGSGFEVTASLPLPTEGDE